MNNLVFYDKEGNSLNFNYNDTLERYEGDILFDSNSNDTFKTQAIYTFERIKGFEFENPSSLTLRKWQLFNEFGFHFYASNFYDEIITSIEPTNLDPSFYSKWIYGADFHKKFPIGTLIRFNTSVLEFTNTNQLFSVVSVKKNAILIISNMDNRTFANTIWGSYTYQLYPYGSDTISSVDVIGIYDYVNSITLRPNLSPWNEVDFFTRIYKNRKLNIVNTNDNDRYKQTLKYIDVSVVTVENEFLFDNIFYHYSVGTLPVDNNFVIEVKLKTDLPIIYSGGVLLRKILTINSVDYNNVAIFSQLPIPTILKPGTEFRVPDCLNNYPLFRISDIPTFVGNANLVTYNEGQQVIWNNKIYQCSQTYTWVANSSLVDLTLTPPRDIATPDDDNYWQLPTYLPLQQVINDETLVSTDVYLNQDKFYFVQSFTLSSEITLASSVEKFASDLKYLNIDLTYQISSRSVSANLLYPSRWAEVNFYGYTSSFSLTSSSVLGSFLEIYERAIETKENLNQENNFDLSRNFSYNVVFTDIDEYGIIFKINGQVYQQEVQWVYSSGQIDMPRTIHKTLVAWIGAQTYELTSLGVITSLQIIGSGIWYNSINLRTEYPNVPLKFTVQVGSTGNFYIQKSKLTFYEPSQLASTLPVNSQYAGASYSLGNYIDIRINNRSYGITHSLPNPFSTINQTLARWVDEYADILDNYGIFVENQASSINFNVKNLNQRCDIEVRVASSVLPGDLNYKIIDQMPGNHGALLTSNEILLGTYSTDESFEDNDFATGMVTGINETIYPLQNIEYNILFLDPGVINLSYEGPFWGLTSAICSNSPFTVVAFSNGFTQSVCPPGFTGSGGMFSSIQFSSAFSILNLSDINYEVNGYDGIDNMVDLVYVQISNSIMVLGDNIRVFDSKTGQFIKDIILSGNTNSRRIIFNSFDNHAWALSENEIWQIDPFSNSVISQNSIPNTAYSLDFNRINGDVYVTTNSEILIFNGGVLVETIDTSPYLGSYDLVFNDFEEDMYVACRDGLTLLRINGSTRTIQTSYNIVGLTGDSLLYDSANEAIYIFGTNLNKVDANTITTLSSLSGVLNSLSYNISQSGVNISTPNDFSLVDDFDNYIYTTSPSIYGYQVNSLYDSNIYLSNQYSNSYGIYVLNSTNGTIANYFQTTSQTNRIITDPDRNSVWALIPSENKIIEVVSNLTFQITQISFTYSGVTENYFGSLNSEYVQRNYLWLHTQDFIRRPRANFNGDAVVSLYWRWFSDNVPQFFLYDFSGDLLPTTGALAYTGPKPLTTIHLNRNANRNPAWKSLPEYQQTIFDVIEHELSYVDDADDLSIVPEPIETFIGFNSEEEGGLRSILQLYKKENVDFTIDTNLNKSDVINFETIFDADGNVLYGLITLDLNSSSNFLNDSNGNIRGLKVGQNLAIFIKDQTNTRKQYLSDNNGYLVRITDIFFKQIKVSFFKSIDKFTNEMTVISNYPKNGQTTYLSVRFKVWDIEIGRFNVYGETEIEDIRFKTELGNVGKLVSSDDVYIFKEYDIKEEGIDWIYLNRKRKEMLMMRSLIYPYIGSYKAIINAINYFGYNDLELYEYYKNINTNSANFGKLFKVEIPDIFDTTSEGWKDNDFLKHTFPNANYEDTNLFNLTFRITDIEGNNVLTYTLEEVQKKLNGLKYWLQKNIIPLSHKILDITGRADFVGQTTITHIVRDVNIIKVFEDFTPVSFNLNELYLMPVNNGSTVYNCVLDFYLPNIQYHPYTGITQSDVPDIYTVDIRTYQIYREWYPFKDYIIGDKVLYYNKLYESVIGDEVNPNRLNNPRKYENVNDWKLGTIYNVSDLVKYNREVYIYSGYGVTSSTPSTISPFTDSGGTSSNWINITEWKEIDLSPIQRITERRRIDNLYPYNFTIDSNIDPYLVIEVTSENGYGANYRDRKNYEIRGLLDIRELESYVNLTSKQYTNAVIGIVQP